MVTDSCLCVDTWEKLLYCTQSGAEPTVMDLLIHNWYIQVRGFKKLFVKAPGIVNLSFTARPDIHQLHTCICISLPLTFFVPQSVILLRVYIQLQFHNGNSLDHVIYIFKHSQWVPYQGLELVWNVSSWFLFLSLFFNVCMYVCMFISVHEDRNTSFANISQMIHEQWSWLENTRLLVER